MATTQPNEPKFTEAPWTPVQVGDDFEIRAQAHVSGLIGKVFNPFSGTGEPSNIELEAEETKANADVFASAPRLYWALANLVDQVRHPKRNRARSALMDAADAALAQARGERA